MDDNETVLTFKESLKQTPAFGTILSLPSPEIAELMALSGFDWLFVDMEHGAFNITECQRMLQSIGDKATTLVRVPELTEASIKKVLDAGAGGIIVPRINTAQEAANAVNWSKYPPQGERGVGATRAHGYGLKFQEYVTSANRDLMVVVQIEHIEGVRNINKILAVPGVDVIFIGPYDLSASMDLIGEVCHPEVIKAIELVEKACEEKDMAMGFFGMTAEAVKPYIAKGYKLITCGTDTGFLTSGASDTLSQLKT
jgi:2-dehydro-3-deoxyglucarate aldolase/4-hydroxy-2-oxoheptanedioate aldolase